MKSFREQARAWAAADPDPATRAEIETWLEANDEESLAAAFETSIGFGTAGLRGPVGPGSSRMNVAVVARVSWALGTWLRKANLAEKPIVLGFDGRQASRVFARVAAEVLSGLGLSVLSFPEPVPTPLVAFAVRHLGACAGVAVTPSHNPRGDAGYKVYDEHGIQIVAPWDREIAALIKRCPSPIELLRNETHIVPLTDAVLGAYCEWLASLDVLIPNTIATERTLPAIAYTPLHGVGYSFAKLAVEGVAKLVPVSEQVQIDGEFPTTPFPNPEEKGSLDLLKTLMGRDSLELGAANDPDADRLALVAPHNEKGELAQLSGDQLGLLFADAVLTAGLTSSPLVVSSVVSSPALQELAKYYGARCRTTLTGFKWLARAGEGDPEFLFAYEEALGYCFALPGAQSVLDKDGLAALRLIARMVDVRGKDETLGQAIVSRRIALAEKVGLWVSAGRSIRIGGKSPMVRMAEVMEALRRAPPAIVGSLRVREVVDFAQGGATRPAYLGEQDLLILEVGTRSRICVRPSGTEPKLKLYVHHVGEFTTPSVGLPTPASPTVFSELEETLIKEAEELAAQMASLLFPDERP